MIAVSHLWRRRLEAPDGRTVGRLLDVLFEEGTWHVRWLLVRPRGTRGAAEVLLRPADLAGPPARRGPLVAAVPIAGCPSAEADLPVSRRRCRWSTDLAHDRDPCRRPGAARPLQSGREIAGYAALAGDGALGRVCDLLVDESAWTISALVVRPGAFRRGRAVPVGALRGIDWEDGTVRLAPGAVGGHDGSLPVPG